MLVDSDHIARDDLFERHLNLNTFCFSLPYKPDALLADGEQLLDGTPCPTERQGLEELADVEEPEDGEGDDVLAQHERDDGRGRDEGVGPGVASTAK